METLRTGTEIRSRCVNTGVTTSTHLDDNTLVYLCTNQNIYFICIHTYIHILTCIHTHTHTHTHIDTQTQKHTHTHTHTYRHTDTETHTHTHTHTYRHTDTETHTHI